MYLLLIRPQSAYQDSVFTFNFEQVFVSRVLKTSRNILKTQKVIYLFCKKVARPILLSDLSLDRIEMNYEHMTIFQL